MSTVYHDKARATALRVFRYLHKEIRHTMEWHDFVGTAQIIGQEYKAETEEFRLCKGEGQ